MNPDNENVVPFIFDKYYDAEMFDEEGKKENFIQQLSMAGCVDVLRKVEGTEKECEILQKAKDDWKKYFDALVECIVAVDNDGMYAAFECLRFLILTIQTARPNRNKRR